MNNLCVYIFKHIINCFEIYLFLKQPNKHIFVFLTHQAEQFFHTNVKPRPNYSRLY